MKGIDYLVDETGRKKAAVIDLKLWGEEWEDFCDGLASELRKDEDRIPWKVLKDEIAAGSTN